MKTVIQEHQNFDKALPDSEGFSVLEMLCTTTIIYLTFSFAPMLVYTFVLAVLQGMA